jgi:membrane fusion protein (multidrug efflux system)
MKCSNFIIAAFLSVILLACKQSEKKTELKKSNVDSAAAFVLKKTEVNKVVSFPAELIPLEKAEVLAKVSGYVKTVKADIGDRVQNGQILAILDAPEMSANMAQANADIQVARSKYVGSLDSYKRILNASKVEGTIAANELEKVRSQMMADSSALDAAKSRSASVAKLKDYLIIRAPFAGIITQRNIDPGALVGTGNSKPLFIVENTSLLRLRIPVPEAYTAAIPDPSVISFTVDAEPGVVYKASLSRKSGSLNLANRTETWEFIYPNKNNELKSGMFANATLNLGRKGNSFVVPSSAIATNQERRFVIRLKDGKAEWVDVKNGITMNDKTEIFGRLNEGDILLMRATDEVKEGATLVAKY